MKEPKKLIVFFPNVSHWAFVSQSFLCQPLPFFLVYPSHRHHRVSCPILGVLTLIMSPFICIRLCIGEGAGEQPIGGGFWCKIELRPSVSSSTGREFTRKKKKKEHRFLTLLFLHLFLFSLITGGATAGASDIFFELSRRQTSPVLAR